MVAQRMWKPEPDFAARGEGPLYSRLVDAIERDISAGLLAAGAPLPPHRKLAELLDVGVGTITRAYREAESRGLIEGHVGRGTVVRGAAPPEAGPAAAPAAPATGLGAAPAGGALNLALNEPPPGPALAPMRRALESPDFVAECLARTGYGPAAGHERHRRAAARWLAGRGVEASWNDVVLCNGAQHALSLALGSLLGPGDVLLAEEVTYTGLRMLADAMGLRVAPLPMDREGILPDAVGRVAAATGARALYTMPTLHNPTTRTMSLPRRREVVAAARRAGVTIVEDDVYGALLPGAPPPLAGLAPDLVFFVSSLSKVVSPALRTGFLTAPNGRHLGRAARALQAGALTTGSFNTALAALMIETGLADEALRGMVAESVRRLGLLRGAMGPDIALESAGAGFHVWIPMARREAERVVSGALQESIALTPPSTVMVEGGEGSGLRLCVGAVASDAELAGALSTLRTLLA